MGKREPATIGHKASYILNELSSLFGIEKVFQVQHDSTLVVQDWVQRNILGRKIPDTAAHEVKRSVGTGGTNSAWFNLLNNYEPSDESSYASEGFAWAFLAFSSLLTFNAINKRTCWWWFLFWTATLTSFSDEHANAKYLSNGNHGRHHIVQHAFTYYRLIFVARKPDGTGFHWSIADSNTLHLILFLSKCPLVPLFKLCFCRVCFWVTA